MSYLTPDEAILQTELSGGHDAHSKIVSLHLHITFQRTFDRNRSTYFGAYHDLAACCRARFA